MKDAAEEIAPGAISLVDAYERVFRAMNPEARPGYPRTPLEWDEHDYAELCANEVLRNGLANGALKPLVCLNGVSREISRDGWKIPGQFPRQDWMPDCFPQTGINSNFVGPNDPTNPGPRTDIDGKRHAVFLDTAHFDRWFNSIFPAQGRQAEKVTPEPHRGRKKKGDGSFDALDQPLLEEIATLLREKKAASVQEAARMVAAKAHGAGTLDSKATRLRRAYKRFLARQEAIAP